MKQLLEFVLEGVVGNKKFEIEEKVEGDHFSFIVFAPKESMGLIIGKGGRMIRAIRNLLRVRATLEHKGVSLAVEEKTTQTD